MYIVDLLLNFTYTADVLKKLADWCRLSSDVNRLVTWHHNFCKIGLWCWRYIHKAHQCSIHIFRYPAAHRLSKHGVEELSREEDGKELGRYIFLESTLGLKSFGKVSCFSRKTVKLLNLLLRLKSIWVGCSARMNPDFGGCEIWLPCFPKELS